MQTEELPIITREEETYLNQPYGGLFGNSVIASVVEELVADPTMDYRPGYLKDITGKSDRSIHTALKKLVNLKLIEKVAGDDKHPVYHVRVESKKFVALSFLAYAMLDDRDCSDCMDVAIHEYYNSILRERYEPLATATMQDYRTASTAGIGQEKEVTFETSAVSA